MNCANPAYVIKHLTGSKHCLDSLCRDDGKFKSENMPNDEDYNGDDSEVIDCCLQCV